MSKVLEEIIQTRAGGGGGNGGGVNILGNKITILIEMLTSTVFMQRKNM